MNIPLSWKEPFAESFAETHTSFYYCRSKQSYIVWIILTFYWHPTLWWSPNQGGLLWNSSFTLVKAFIRLGHCRDEKLPSGIILEEFAVFIEIHLRKKISCLQLAAESNRVSLSHRMDWAHQDRIIACKKIEESGVSCFRMAGAFHKNE